MDSVESEASERMAASRADHIHQSLRLAPPLVLAAFIVASLLRAGVSIIDVGGYGAYWLVAVIAPGMVAARSLIGVRKTLVEDIAIAAVTGISLEVLAWVVGVTTGLGPSARWWWVPVLLAGIAVPTLRRRTFVRVPQRLGAWHSAALTAVTVGILLRLVEWFRVTPVPPRSGAIYPDLWWQLSLVQEMMRYRPPQVPQVAGEAFHYHFFANAQIASGVLQSGVLPEVVLLRLWVFPVVLISVGLGFILGRLLTASWAGGVVTTAAMYGAPIVTYIWPGITWFVPTQWPFTFSSPTQMLANTGTVAAAIGVVLLLRRGPSPGLVAWTILIVLGASGEKSTVVPILFAGTLVAWVTALTRRSWSAARLLGLATLGLGVLEVIASRLAAGMSGGEFVLLGTLRGLPAFEALVRGHGVRAMNHGILMDSIDSTKTAAYAILVVVVLLAVHAIRLAGVAGLARRRLRADPVIWWLAGATVGGYVATFAFDHVGLSQLFFALTAGQLGTALTVAVGWDALKRWPVDGRRLAAFGLAAGAIATLVIDGTIDVARTAIPEYGALDALLLPPAVLVALVGAGWAVWRRWRRRSSGTSTHDAAWVVALGALLGLLLPSAAAGTYTAADHWRRPFSYAHRHGSSPHLTHRELSSIIWLRAHSRPNDVVMTNVHCTRVTTTAHCPTRSFWVSGLSGRRVVLEGWAFTDEAQSAQGVGGRPYDMQPAPFPARFRTNQAVFEHSSRSALTSMRSTFGVRWIVAVHRAGRTPSFPAALARKRYDNGAVTILEVR